MGKWGKAEVKVAGSCQWIFHCFSVGASTLCGCVWVYALKLQIGFCGFSRTRPGKVQFSAWQPGNKEPERLIKLPETDLKSNNETMATAIMSGSANCD